MKQKNRTIPFERFPRCSGFYWMNSSSKARKVLADSPITLILLFSGSPVMVNFAPLDKSYCEQNEKVEATCEQSGFLKYLYNSHSIPESAANMALAELLMSEDPLIFKSIK